MKRLKDKIKSLPDKPGVYLFKDKNGSVIYVGKAKSLKKRVASYFKAPLDSIKTSLLVSKIHDLDYILTSTETDALLLEEQLVKKYDPRYNVELRDDKAYPFLKLTVNEEWPRLLMVRRRQNDGAKYFGPYRSKTLREILQTVKKLFPIRWCKASPLNPRQQPCLQYHIGNCAGPCIARIAKDEYRGLVQGIILLLEGNFEETLEKLKSEMHNAAKSQNFELAGQLRDRIKTLERMQEGQLSLERASGPKDLTGPMELQKVLGLLKMPIRIEAFDVSNLQKSAMVGSMVSFLGGRPNKRDYRKFKIKSTTKPDDVAAIREIVSRRYGGQLAKKMVFPDLILIDGGIGQLRAAYQALRQLKLADLPLISLAKRQEEIYLLTRRQPIRLKQSSRALQLIQRIRDEAHRFAITYHRQKRSRALYL